ncbi:MAG: hypothetical protein JNN11_05300 [Candidatus Doudnabacteria bacterium]|nr:hypothetical protein [Candidatus Doudnabacteria bacterium]
MESQKSWRVVWNPRLVGPGSGLYRAHGEGPFVGSPYVHQHRGGIAVVSKGIVSFINKKEERIALSEMYFTKVNE